MFMEWQFLLGMKARAMFMEWQFLLGMIGKLFFIKKKQI